MEKLVSIAMITYNHAKFIKDALDSCLNQTYKNIEICISDDCSSDNTVYIIKEYQKKYPNKIKLYTHLENMGKYTIAINANRMYDLCLGEYIAILEGDDIMFPERISEQVIFLERNPSYVCVSHNCETFDDETGNIIPDFFSNLKVNNRDTKTLISNGNSVHTPTVMFRNINLRTNYHIKFMIDWFFFIEMSMYGKIGHQDKVLTRYRRHANGVSQNRDIMLNDELITLALIESKYPQYLKEVQYTRFRIYFKKFKNGNKEYIKGLFSYRFSFIANKVLYKLKMIK